MHQQHRVHGPVNAGAIVDTKTVEPDFVAQEAELRDKNPEQIRQWQKQEPVRRKQRKSVHIIPAFVKPVTQFTNPCTVTTMSILSNQNNGNNNNNIGVNAGNNNKNIPIEDTLHTAVPPLFEAEMERLDIEVQRMKGTNVFYQDYQTKERFDRRIRIMSEMAKECSQQLKRIREYTHRMVQINNRDIDKASETLRYVQQSILFPDIYIDAMLLESQESIDIRGVYEEKMTKWDNEDRAMEYTDLMEDYFRKKEKNDGMIRIDENKDDSDIDIDIDSSYQTRTTVKNSKYSPNSNDVVNTNNDSVNNNSVNINSDDKEDMTAIMEENNTLKQEKQAILQLAERFLGKSKWQDFQKLLTQNQIV